MSGHQGVPAAIQTAAALRADQAVQLRLKGYRWAQISEQLGYKSPGGACTAVKNALGRARKDLALNLEEWLEQELQRLEALERTAQAVIEEYDSEIGSLESVAAEIVKSLATDGVTDVDAAVDRLLKALRTKEDQRLAAIDRLVRIAQRRASLLGLDQPAKVELSGQVLYAVEGVNVDALK